MNVDMGEQYEREIHEIVQDLEASGREAGVDNSLAREKEKCNVGFRPLTAPKKKMWVQPESVVKQEEDGEKSSDEESSSSRRSPLSAISSGRRVPERKEGGPTRVCPPF